MSPNQTAHINAQTPLIASTPDDKQTLLPYDLYTHGGLSADRQSLEIKLRAGSQAFGHSSSANLFTVCSRNQSFSNSHFSAPYGHEVVYKWPVDMLNNGEYHLCILGPNGFYREFAGNASHRIDVVCYYIKNNADSLSQSGNVVVEISNNDIRPQTIVVRNKHQAEDCTVTETIAPGDKASVILNLNEEQGCYAFAVKLATDDTFEQRFAGRVETADYYLNAL